MPVRVLQSFPHKIGAGRICTTAWHEAEGAAAAGADVSVWAGVVHRPLPPAVHVRTTLSRGRWRIPYGVIGHLRALELHDLIVARALPRLADRIDLVHAWPLAAVHTLRAARRLGIPSVLERPNAHTRFAYEAVAAECRRLGVQLPPDHEHAYNAQKLAKEEEEYALADGLLCPSDFVAQSFVDEGFAEDRLLRHAYGFDERRFHPDPDKPAPGEGLNALFVGVCAVRKGLHFALEAWLRSPASEHGTFRIAGEFLPAYHEKLKPMLEHPSVEVLGHRTDAQDLMRRSDILMLPSIEEGLALTSLESVGSGCVPLVSDACTDVCIDGVNSFVHPVGDVAALAQHLTIVHRDRERLARMRAACLDMAPGHTWLAAGRKLVTAYEQAVDRFGPGAHAGTTHPAAVAA